MPLYKVLGYGGLKLPRALSAAAHVRSLPVHPGLKAQEIEKVADEFLKAVRG
jgi:dTDP-4-amino-4,6-dideoxygalactose transaminase